MIDVTRHELLRQLTRLSELAPDIRLGQLIANLATMADAPWDETLWDLEDEKLLAAGFAEIRKGAPCPPVAGKADLENAELFNIGAGLLKPEEKLKSYDGLYTDEYVR